MLVVFYKCFLLYIKMSEITDLTYYQENRNVNLNKAKDYCGKNRYHNMSEGKKQWLKEYQKDYYKTKMSQYNTESNSFLIVIAIAILIIIIIEKINFLIEI